MTKTRKSTNLRGVLPNALYRGEMGDVCNGYDVDTGVKFLDSIPRVCKMNRHKHIED